MRRARGQGLTVRCGRAAVALGCALILQGCGAERPMVEVPGGEGRLKSAATTRAARRAYDGAPPVIPHENFRSECTSCHDEQGVEVPHVGFAPPMPHEKTGGLSAISRCAQCHVFHTTDDLFVDNSFSGLRQDLRAGTRLHDNAPPVIPHKQFMRENCAACHTGPAAREEVRTSHPERVRCGQCHVPVTVRTVFHPEGEMP